jgi:hypothetical protein
MTRIYPQDLPAFLRKYRFPGGRVRGVRVGHKGKDVAVEFRLAVREALRDLGAEPKPVRLVLKLAGVEEFRVQMRPNQPKAKIADARVAYLNGLFYVNLDAWSLEPGEQPGLHDFRASELYAAGRELWWETVNREPRASE